MNVGKDEKYEEIFNNVNLLDEQMIPQPELDSGLLKPPEDEKQNGPIRVSFISSNKGSDDNQDNNSSIDEQDFEEQIDSKKNTINKSQVPGVRNDDPYSISAG